MCNLLFIMCGIVVLWKCWVCEFVNILDFIYFIVLRILLFFFIESYYNLGKFKNEVKILKILIFEKEIFFLMNMRKIIFVYLEVILYLYIEIFL